jgi:membrane protease YdiL (CAAX protease family)
MRPATNSISLSSWFPWEYFLIAFGWSWLFWSPLVLETLGVIKLPLPREVFLLLSILGPLLGAMWVNHKKGGWKTVGSLFLRAIDFRFKWTWWLAIIILPFVVSTMAFIIYCLIKDLPVDLSTWKTPWMVIPSILFQLIIGGGEEEFGWRGVALDALQSRWSALVSSIALGLIHAVWHLPLFFIQGVTQYYMSFWLFLLMGPANSILFTWFYNSTGKKLFTAILFHATLNASFGVFPLFPNASHPGQTGFLIEGGLLWMWALIVLAIFGGKTLAKSGIEVFGGTKK